MKYFSNYMLDAVVREDDNGNRYVKCTDYSDLDEHLASEDDEMAWGGESYGVFYILKKITKEEYDTFGKTWDWSPIDGKKRSLVSL